MYTVQVYRQGWQTVGHYDTFVMAWRAARLEHGPCRIVGMGSIVDLSI